VAGHHWSGGGEQMAVAACAALATLAELEPEDDFEAQLALEAQLEEELRCLEEEVKKMRQVEEGWKEQIAERCRVGSPALVVARSSACDLVEGRCRNAGVFDSGVLPLELEDLPLERICLFVTVPGLVRLRMAGVALGLQVAMLLERLVQRWHAVVPPLLLPLLHFLSCVQAPLLDLSCLMEEETWAPQARSLPRSGPLLQAGHAVEVSRGIWAGQPGSECFCPLRLEAEPSRQGRAPPRDGAPPRSYPSSFVLEASFSRPPSNQDGAYICSWALGGHTTPRVLRLCLHCELAAEMASMPAEVSVSLVDTAVPKQPLFSVSWEVCEVDNCSVKAWRQRFRPALVVTHLLRATLREVVGCPGGTLASWTYRQSAWSLGRCDAADRAAAFLSARGLSSVWCSSISGLGGSGDGEDSTSAACELSVGEAVPASREPRGPCGRTFGPWLQLHFEFDWENALCVALVNGCVVSRQQDTQELGSLGIDRRREFGGAEPTVDQVRIQLPPGVSLALAEFLVG